MALKMEYSLFFMGIFWDTHGKIVSSPERNAHGYTAELNGKLESFKLRNVVCAQFCFTKVP